VVDLNRGVAVAMAFGPAAGLQLVDELVKDAALQGDHPIPAVRRVLLLRLDCRPSESRDRAGREPVTERARARMVPGA
jgi:predicted RNA polymerase sigma factor